MRPLWAVVRLTIAEAIRARIALVFEALLIALMVILTTTATGDGTVSGKIQMFTSYSIGITYFLLGQVVILLICGMIDRDIKTQRIDSLVTKPLPRWQFLLGRWLGVLLVAAALLLIAMAVTYAIVIWGFAPRVEAKSEDEFRLRNQVLVARRSVMPDLPDVSEEVEKRYQQAMQEGALMEIKNLRPSEIRKLIRDELINRMRTVPPQHGQTWTLKGLAQPKEGDAVITLRFKYEPSITTSGSEEHELHGNTVFGQWIIGRRESPKAYLWMGEKPYRTAHELNVPINAIEPDGTLEISFVNLDPRGVAVHFPVKDGIEVLIRTGDFEPNFIRTVLLALMTVIFLATLALACSTFLSFHVAWLLSLSVFFVGIAGNFLSEAIGVPYGVKFDGTVVENVEKAVTLAAVWLVPVLDVGAYTDKLIDGRLIEWLDVGRQFVRLLLIECTLLTAFAIFVFNRRELGKVIV